MVVNKVSLALKEKYNSKCGYCECHEANPQVEHHRPKGFVTGGGNLLNGTRNKGYHWLAYEWTNMVASCSRCNSKKYKGTKFPVEVESTQRKINYPNINNYPNYSNYRYNSNYLKSEKPLILHPDYCYPKKHLKFERDGEIKHLTKRGEKSIEVYGLNDSTIVVQRLELYNDIMSQINRLVSKRFRVIDPKPKAYLKEELGEIYVELIKKANDHTNSFTFFRKEMQLKFSHFFIDTFPKRLIRNELRDVYLEILVELK